MCACAFMCMPVCASEFLYVRERTNCAAVPRCLPAISGERSVRSNFN